MIYEYFCLNLNLNQQDFKTKFAVVSTSSSKGSLIKSNTLKHQAKGGKTTRTAEFLQKRKAAEYKAATLQIQQQVAKAKAHITIFEALNKESNENFFEGEDRNMPM